MLQMTMNLRDARLNAGLTLQQVANAAKVSRPTVEKAESGREAISKAYAVRIVRALNDLAGTNYTVDDLGIVTGR
jgi:transcriptional regulator with XRE-family HTH domain